MSIYQRAVVTFQVVRELGFQQPFYNFLYRAGLKTGYFRWRTPFKPHLHSPLSNLKPFLTVPSREMLIDTLQGNLEEIILEAGEIVNGQVRLFGGPPTHLELKPPGELHHWTDYENRSAPWGTQDIKFIWEPARFGWVFPLARAYLLTGQDDYAQTFWQLTESFLTANPANLGPNWTSAQEIALRIMALSFASQVFTSSPASTDRRKKMLADCIFEHAARIPPTLVYARSQNNNHLLTEAVGLYTAGILLADLPQASGWRRLGWHWLNRALQQQLASDGTYVQHSTNYHRLMLHNALWVDAISRQNGVSFPPETRRKLAAATLWLLNRLDPISGQVPNLGHNDGAYILPLSCGGYVDYRSTAQAASRAFLGQPCLPPGPWDELSLWLGLAANYQPLLDPNLQPTTSAVLPRSSRVQELITNHHSRISNSQSWGSLRTAWFNSRPAHADQLHVDLWWRGQNIALDAGTYQYNAAPPWENSLAGTAVHDTVMVDEQDQMRRASRFLWLNWAQGKTIREECSDTRLVAEHNGYQHLGIIHRRSLEQITPTRWQIEDYLLPAKNSIIVTHSFILHWLLPDCPWEMDGLSLHLQAPVGRIVLSIELEPRPLLQESHQLIRAGKILSGTGTFPPILGWYSPTYGYKLPALSFRVLMLTAPPIHLTSKWSLGETSHPSSTG